MRLPFDPNTRFGDLTYVPLDECPADVRSFGAGDPVAVYAEEARLEGRAIIEDIDDDFVTLRVQWGTLSIVAMDSEQANLLLRSLVPPVSDTFEVSQLRVGASTSTASTPTWLTMGLPVPAPSTSLAQAQSA